MIQSKSRRVTLLAVALILMSFAVGYARTQPSYTFKVHNKGKNKIVKLLVSEDGKEYKLFDIGDGIAAGETATLVWDKSTDNGYCEWWFKAAFDDNEESKPVKFDFCEKDLVLEIQ
jgi:hypothetical protein